MRIDLMATMTDRRADVGRIGTPSWADLTREACHIR